MHKILTAAFLSTILLSSCGGKDSLDVMKSKLADLKSQQDKLSGQIDFSAGADRKAGHELWRKGKGKVGGPGYANPYFFHALYRSPG